MEPKAWVWVAEHCRMARRKCGSRTKSIRLIIWILLFGLWIKKRGTKEKYPNWSRLICRVSIIGSEYPVMDALLLCEKWWKAEAVDAHPVSVKAEMRKGTGNFLPPFQLTKKAANLFRLAACVAWWTAGLFSCYSQGGTSADFLSAIEWCIPALCRSVRLFWNTLGYIRYNRRARMQRPSGHPRSL